MQAPSSVKSLIFVFFLGFIATLTYAPGMEKKSQRSHGPKGPKYQHPKRRSKAADEDRPLWLYGRHAVAAALQNKARKVHRVLATLNAAQWLKENWHAQDMELPDLEDHKPAAMDGMLPPGAVHQGLAALVDDLPRKRLKEACQITPSALAPVLVLDQITDPQNIGALFRSASAFGAKALITQERRTPPLAGALAKAAAGAVETVPCVQAVNVSRALEALQELGYYCAGLAGESTAPLKDIPPGKPVALVLGAEGAGLRQLVGETCDGLFRIPIKSEMESLNVSNAGAIALYELSSR